MRISVWNQLLAAVCGAVFAFVVLAGGAQAQPWRAGDTFYGKVGVGLAEYTGDNSPGGVPYRLGHFGEDAGFPYVLRGEVGYQFLPQLAIGVGIETGNYPFSDQSERLDGRRSALQLLLRYTYGAEERRWAPYVDVGRVVTFGGVRGGHGVSVGIGMDYALTRRVSLYAEARSNTLWPDNAIDDRGIGTEGVDHLSQLLGVGVKVDLRPAPVPPRIRTIAGSTRVEVGQAVTYTARVSEQATRPLSRKWTVEGSPAGSTQTVRHTFAHAGTHTVAFVAQNEGGTTRDSLRVEVVPPPEPAVISEMSVRPRPAKTGQTIQFAGRAEGDQPVSYAWRFGDGTAGAGASATHVYAEAGTYTVHLTTKNEAGQDVRRLQLRIRRRRAPVSGMVTDAETGDPLLNTRLRAVPIPDTLEMDPTKVDKSALRARADSVGREAQSGAGGAFSLNSVPVGPVMLLARKAGFEPAFVPVDHSRGDTTQVTLSLVPGRETAASIERDLARTGRRVLENVHFGFDSASIEPGEEGEATLRAVLKVIRNRMSDKSFLIEGHTDSQGPSAYNQDLSERRAQSVVEWLVEHGVDPDRIEAQGQGETDPIASNETEEGRRENRRTEIVVR